MGFWRSILFFLFGSLEPMKSALLHLVGISVLEVDACKLAYGIKHKVIHSSWWRVYELVPSLL